MDDIKTLNGVYDNSKTNCREVWKSGLFMSCYERRLLGNVNTRSEIISKPWGAFPIISAVREDHTPGELD